MDGFTYHDIFQTKGIEYIVIIAFLFILIPFWVIINRKEQISRNIRKVFRALTIDNLQIRKGLFYSKNHTWTHLEKSGAAQVGLDDLLLHLTGEVRLHFMKNPEDIITRGDLLAEIDQKGKLLRIFSPISGKILDTNSLLNEDPGIINEDPYGRGWICKIQPTNWIDETKSYFLGGEAINWSKNEVERLKDFLALSMIKSSPEPSMIVLQDGGEIGENALSEMPSEVWQDFQQEFLDQKF